MNNNDWLLVVVVAVAFIAGYSIVSFIVKKIKPHKRTITGEGQTGQSQQKKSADQTQDNTGFNSNHSEEEEYQDETGKRAQESRQSETWESQTEEQRYGRVLGLKGKFTLVDLKRAYRELMTKYHPDKVSHLGAEFKEIAKAKTQEIIEAYEFFRKKYDIK